MAKYACIWRTTSEGLESEHIVTEQNTPYL